MKVTIQHATASAVRPLRRAVLRQGMTNQTVDFDDDENPNTVHLVACDADGEIVGVSTWIRRTFPLDPHLPAIQLRGMATAVDRQSSGIGGKLLIAGLDNARQQGISLVWANARDTALSFYNSNGFSTQGDGFIEPVTQLGHHCVVHYLKY